MTDKTLSIDHESEEKSAAAECFKLVKDAFHGDEVKTNLWFAIENPFLGGVKPNDMIRVCRARKLLRIIQANQAGDMP